MLEAGGPGFLLKSDARRFLIAAVESLAAHKPFFTSQVSETLLETYLAKGATPDRLLTAREKSVVQLIAEGHTNKRIADVLSISLKTVESIAQQPCASSTSTPPRPSSATRCGTRSWKPDA